MGKKNSSGGGSNIPDPLEENTATEGGSNIPDPLADTPDDSGITSAVDLESGQTPDDDVFGDMESKPQAPKEPLVDVTAISVGVYLRRYDPEEYPDDSRGFQIPFNCAFSPLFEKSDDGKYKKDKKGDRIPTGKYRLGAWLKTKHDEQRVIDRQLDFLERKKAFEADTAS